MSATLRRILILAKGKSSHLLWKGSIGVKLSCLNKIVDVIESKKSGEL